MDAENKEMPDEFHEVRLEVQSTKWQETQRKSKKELLLENVAELDQFADQLMMLEDYQDRLNGSNIKESLEAIKNIIEDSIL